MPNWNEIFKEFQRRQAEGHQAFDLVRRKYLKELNAHTDRNVIAYYSGWLSKPNIAGLLINDEDKNGFMSAVHQLDKKKGLDLLLHTPGGSISSTQSIVDYLHRIFKRDIRAFIPQIAMSAGTTIACSCKEIWMGKQSNLGPIDPQLSAIPAYGVLREFKRACKEVKTDPKKIPIWQSIIGQYRPTFIGQCENAIKWSNDFVRQQLATVMFQGDPAAKKKANAIVKTLTSYTKNRTHDRHLHYDECKAMGLKVFLIESDPKLQDLVLSIHHCYIHILMNTLAFKVIENHLGAALVRNIAQRPTGS
jgi:ClpP class serine protease